MPFLKALLALFLSLLSAFNPFDGPHEVPRREDHENFEYLEYPEEAIKKPNEVSLTLNQFISRADDDGDELYENAQGYTDINGIIPSPYFSVKVEKKEIPAYATTVFVGETQKGALHSFCEIYVDTRSGFPFDFILNTHGFIIDNVTVFPRSSNLTPSYNNTILHESITQLGTYTFVFNNNDQEHAFTLFVRELVDEDREIKEYQNQGYNVIVVEKGFHKDIPAYDFYGTQNTIYYLKRGAYLLAKHIYDISSENDDYYDTSKQDLDLLNANHLPLGLTRCPYLNYTCCNNIKLVGNGVIDFSHIDRRERRGIVFSYSNNIVVDGIKIVNPAEWAFITYDCKNITIKNVDIFGYRTNADAFAICNTRNATIDNSFCRSGDDLFDVKAVGGREEAISQNITFTNCTAWNGKARCFGICGEVYKDIKDVTFKDSTVVFHDATWNKDRIPALAIVVEDGSVGSINNVTFENIDVYVARSRAIGCLIYGSNVENFNITNIKYKNIRYHTTYPAKVASNGKVNNIQAEFENVYANGSKITEVNKNIFEYDKYASISVK